MHQWLRIERPFIVFDLETTGVDTDTARIVEIGLQVYGPNGLEKEWSSLINPGCQIPPDAERTHHISNQLLETACSACGSPLEAHPVPATIPDVEILCEVWKPIPRFEQLAPNIAKGFSNCDFGGKNVRFDLRIMKAEMDRYRVPWSYAGARVIDAERLEQIGVPRSLSHLYEKYTGNKLDGAHRAIQDVRASSIVIAAQMKAFQEFPRDLGLLHEMQWPGWIDTEGKFRFKDNIAVCTFGKYKDQPMKSIPSDYWRWMLKANFSEEIAAYATNALNGMYPEIGGSDARNNSETDRG